MSVTHHLFVVFFGGCPALYFFSSSSTERTISILKNTLFHKENDWIGLFILFALNTKHVKVTRSDKNSNVYKDFVAFLKMCPISYDFDSPIEKYIKNILWEDCFSINIKLISPATLWYYTTFCTLMLLRLQCAMLWLIWEKCLSMNRRCVEKSFLFVSFLDSHCKLSRIGCQKHC